VCKDSVGLAAEVMLLVRTWQLFMNQPALLDETACAWLGFIQLAAWSVSGCVCCTSLLCGMYVGTIINDADISLWSGGGAVGGQAICLLAFQVHVVLDRVSLRDCHRGFQELLLSVVARFQCFHDATSPFNGVGRQLLMC
jgi:hypothetical protein